MERNEEDGLGFMWRLMLDQRDRSLEVAEENTSNSEVLRPLLKDVNFKDALANGAYDAYDAFEGLFSSIKRVFGEAVRAVSPEGMISAFKSTFIL